MQASITICLPWPDKTLSPNARAHYMAVAATKRKAKMDAYYAALEAGVRSLVINGRVITRWQFYPPDRRRRDLDNCIASCKAYADGLAMALMVDDSEFEWQYPPMGPPTKGGAVEVTIAVVLPWEAKE